MSTNSTVAQPSLDVLLGICVLNWNAGNALIHCLRSIEAASLNFPSRTIVVDNCSSDDSVSLAQRHFPALQVIKNPSNVGYAAGNNIGARALLAEGCNFLMFVNPDVVLGSSSILELLNALKGNARAGLAGAAYSTRQGRRCIPVRTRPSFFEKSLAYSPLSRLSFLRPLHARHFVDIDSLRDGQEVYAVSGACLVFRADAFSQIAGFDERTFLYEEEFTTAERLASAGLASVFSKKAQYFHFDGLSTEQIWCRRRIHFIRSEQYILRQYFCWNLALRLSIRIQRYFELIVYIITRHRSAQRFVPEAPASPEGAHGPRLVRG